MTTRTIYIVPATRQRTSLSLGPASSARQVTISRQVPVAVRQSPVPISPASSRPTVVHNATVLQPDSLRHTFALAQKRPASVLEESATAATSIDELLGLPNGESHPVRKRERLTHLTAEEKLNRRKLKNRVAAQTARDRKKIRTNKLEEAVRKLVNENRALREENKRVNAVCEELKQRNYELEKSLKQSETNNTNTSSTKQSSFGSAESIRGPQQREQATAAVPTLVLLLSFLALISRKSSKICSKMIPSSSSSARKCSTEMRDFHGKVALPFLSLLASRHQPRKSAARQEWIARHRISI